MTNYKNQEGVTLVVAIVLLSAVTFVSFSLSTVALRELKSARLVTNAEPAFAGANAGGETGLYRLQRGAGSISSSNQSLSQSSATYDIIADLLDDPYLYTVAGGQTLNVGLYDPENTNNQDLLYRSVRVANQVNPIRVTVASWFNPNNPVCNNINVPPGGALTCTLVGPDYRYLVTLVNLGAGTSNGTVQAFDGSGILTGPLSAVPAGIPSDKPSIEITGKSGEVRRKIQIKF